MSECKCEVDEQGNKIWWLNNKIHRKDGPAVEHKGGDKSWYLNDKRHREGVGKKLLKSCPNLGQLR